MVRLYKPNSDGGGFFARRGRIQYLEDDEGTILFKIKYFWDGVAAIKIQAGQSSSEFD